MFAKRRWMLARKRASAFTLVEVLAALAFLGILMPVVISALLVSNRAAVTAERRGIAAQLAENELNELLLADAWKSAASQGNFGTDWPGYRWQLEKNTGNSGTGTMTELTLDVFFLVQGREQSVELSTLVDSSATTSTSGTSGTTGTGTTTP
jgi:type II secretory pathway pseudopilin PulG